MRKLMLVGNFSDIFNVAMQRIADHNLSIREIAENTNIDEELLEIFLNNKNNVG